MNWFGYLAIIRLQAGTGKIFFRFSYPLHKCCVKLLLYLRHQMYAMRAHMTCNQKLAVLDSDVRQTILLSPSNPSSGCTSNVTAGGQRVIACSAGRHLVAERTVTWYVAVSSCGSPTGLDIQYSLLIYGHTGRCPHSMGNDSSRPTSSLLLNTALLLSIGILLRL